jgi:protein-tyrosine phosphatase
MASILFVCLGNICRSPLAEGVAAAFAAQHGKEVQLDSAGTGAWHIGNPPDSRSIAIAQSYGVDISRQKARQLQVADFARFDLICAMDRQNLADIEAFRAANLEASDHAEVRLLLDFAPDGIGQDVPDPYYGDGSDFLHVWTLVNQAMPSLFSALLGED